MEIKRGQVPAEPSSRPASPLTPAKKNDYRCQSASPHEKRPAWIVAKWKHRVPDPGLAEHKPAAGQLITERRVQLANNRRQHFEQSGSDYAAIHDIINKILARCSHVQQRLGASTAHQHSSKPQTPTYISARSGLLFDPPASAKLSDSCESTGASNISMQAASTPSVSDAVSTSALKKQKHECQKHMQCTRSWGGAIDLNPGFSFRPGTPQRLTATCSDVARMPIPPLITAPDEQQHSRPIPGSSGKFSSNSDTISGGSSRFSSSNLTHREQLQADIQQLSGEFYQRLQAL